MNFSDICQRVLTYKSQNSHLFATQIRQMDLRAQKAQQHLKQLMEQAEMQQEVSGIVVTLQQEFELFWNEKSHEVRLDMIDKTCEWIGLMKGAAWCGIQSHEWQNQSNLFRHLAHDLRQNPLLLLDMIHQNVDDNFEKVCQNTILYGY